ncbi:MAG: hypothetical protein M0Z98_06165 [Actinomycetales bacterium]|nr:hypothetical protein [Actinomycetales bacterium]
MNPRLTAHRRRVKVDDNGCYEWVICTESNTTSDTCLVLTRGDRARWPALVRTFGITRLDAIAFVNYQERALFALDCDLLDGYRT